MGTRWDYYLDEYCFKIGRGKKKFAVDKPGVAAYGKGGGMRTEKILFSG